MFASREQDRAQDATTSRDVGSSLRVLPAGLYLRDCREGKLNSFSYAGL
jgi:hypothetical protein